MPELPEVETVVRDLRPLVVGRTIRAVRHGPKKLRKPWQAKWNPLVAGTRIEGIRRRGKWMVVNLISGRAVSAPRLILHLGMTGQFTAVDGAHPAPDHLHLVLELHQGRELRFRDPRRFGSVTFHADEAEVEAFFEQNGLGPEPFGLDPAYFRQAVRGTSRTLKAVLLDQRVVAGVGNIYADEACSLAGLHPQRRGKSLTPADADRLRGAIETVLTKAIEYRGSTIRDYVGGSGLRGGFQNEFRVYGRTGDPCRACGTAIACVRLSGRSSHFCPSCQPTHHKGTKAAQRTTKKTQEGIR
ncbi:MAG: mutM [Gemmataceae bacterium]|nr:mutM [Gemmataceae bacterium]